MVKTVYVFDEDIAIREKLWKTFKPRGYLVYCSTLPGACPETFSAKVDCASGHTCGAFIFISIDFPDIPGFELIKDLINTKCCKVKNIALMSTTWADKELELARDLGCKIFQKPFLTDGINDWIDICEEKTLRLSKSPLSEGVTLHQ